MRALERAFPSLSEWERKLKFVEVHYGADLAGRMRRDLVRRGLLVPANG